MWRYPQLDLLMHGYGDTFTIAELQRNTDIQALAPGWDDELRATGVTIAVLRPTTALGLRPRAPGALERASTGRRRPGDAEAPAGWATGG